MSKLGDFLDNVLDALLDVCGIESKRDARVRRLSETFNEAVGAEYRERLKKTYTDRGLIDLSALHLKRAALVLYRRRYEEGREPEFAAPSVEGPPLTQDNGFFQAEVGEGIRLLPPPVRRLMAEFGVKTRLARRLADIDPLYASLPGPEHPDLPMELSLLASYDPRERLITMIQEKRRSEFVNVYSPILHQKNYYTHEAGHFLDAALDDISLKAEFSAAYSGDVEILKTPKMKTPDGKTMNVLEAVITILKAAAALGAGSAPQHYFAREDGGWHKDRNVALKESFAELFSDILDRHPPFLDELLPETKDVMRKILASLDYEMAATPDPDAILAGRPEVRPA